MNSFRNSIDVQSFAIGQIKPYPGHARNHNKRQIEKLQKGILRFGQVIPIVVDGDGVIIDGHAIWTAMQELGCGEIWAVVVASRTGPEIRALRLALNRIPKYPAWDDERLREELEQLVA
jgi:ParB-like chromosome segregation protein Spo0J